MGIKAEEVAPNFIKFRLDLEGKWQEIPAPLCDALGYSAEELKKKNVSELVYPDDRDEFVEYLEAVKKSEQEDLESQIRLFRKDGKTATVFIFGTLIRNKKGNPDHILCYLLDLSRQLEVQQKLEEREQQFESLFKHNPNPVYYFDLEGKFAGVNDRLVEFTGYRREELLSMSYEGFIAEEDLERTKGHFQKAAEGSPGRYEIKVIVKGGVEKDIRVTKFPMMIGDRVTGVFGILQDITGEKNSEKKLKRSEQLFKSLFSHSPYPVMRFDLEGNFKDANKKTVELSGFNWEELMNRNFFDFTSEEDQDRIAAHFKKAVNGEPQRYEIKAKTKNETIEVETTLSPIYVMGEVTGLFCVAKDITDEKRAKRALQKSEQRWQQLVEQNPQPVQIVQDGKIAFLNQAGAKYYGASSPKELIGKSILDFAHPDFKDNLLQRKEKLEQNQSVEPDEHKIVLLNGEERYVEAHSIPISYNGRNAIQTVIHDITDLKEKQDVIGKSLKEKEVLLQEIHHRVKNNLAMISSMLELQIIQSTEEAAINALRDSQLRIQSIAIIHEKLYQNESLDRIGFDRYLQELVESIKKMYDDGDGGVETVYELDNVSLDINQAIPCSLLVNEVIVNCFKHAFPNHGKGTLHLKLDYDEPHLELEIADDGIGLPEDFDMQKQDSLGMTLIQALSSQLEGEISFSESSENGGTKFRLSFRKNSEN